MTVALRNDPNFRLFVDNKEVVGDLTKRVLSIEYDDTIEMAKAIKVVLDNSGFLFTDGFILGVGSELELHMGYGRDLRYLGRGEIIRHLPTFGEGGASTLEVTAYDRSWRMMRQEIEITGAKKTPKKKKLEGGRSFSGRLSKVLKDVLEPYGIRLVIQAELAKKEVYFTQRKGVTDYQVCRSLANLNGADFYVTYVPGKLLRGTSPTLLDVVAPGEWVAVFGKVDPRLSAPAGSYKSVPPGTPLPGQQAVKYKFIYDTGPESTILTVRLEYGIDSTVNEMQVFIFDRKIGEYRLITAEKQGTIPKAAKGAVVPYLDPTAKAPVIDSATKLKIAAAGYSAEVQPQRKFKTAQDAADYAKAWFQRNIDNFIICQGSLPGIETVRAGETHYLGGFGNRFRGEYFFPNFRHTFSDNGYITQFTARKILEKADGP